LFRHFTGLRRRLSGAAIRLFQGSLQEYPFQGYGSHYTIHKNHRQVDQIIDLWQNGVVMDKANLPQPDSEDLKALVKGSTARSIYKVLFENQDKPLSMAEIRKILGSGAGEQEHLNRRMRELYGPFNIAHPKRGSDSAYQLIGFSENPHQDTSRISIKVRAWVLRDQRCAQCGRTPTEDGVKLHVDHIIPQEWGGTDDQENLQALCFDCNEGKKNLYSSYNKFGEKIKQAIGYDEPHRRIGELLKAFGSEPVPAELLETVAKAKQYQDDWQKRMRELRELGWEYTFEKRKEGGRVKTYYILQHWEPWPEGNIVAAIRKHEQEKK
jgi:HNH endonuclease